jgi:dual specificity protein kinase YAK1
VFTQPCEPGPNGYDNLQGDLIVSLHDTIIDPKGPVYTISGCLGHGQFGQVFRVSDLTGASYAMKIARQDTRLSQQALHEAGILRHIQNSGDPQTVGVSRLIDSFISRNHVCIVLELLFSDLYAVIERRRNAGIPIGPLQDIARQLLETLSLLTRCAVVHGDLKPENIVLVEEHSNCVKIIDFGSARAPHQCIPMYIQSRYYRAPEVVLRLPFGHPIDIWSLGCILCELCIGFPIFPAQNEIQLLELICRFLGPVPLEIARASRRFSEFFMPNGALKTEEQVCREKGVSVAERSMLFAKPTIRDVILALPGTGRTAAERRTEKQRRILLIDLVMKLLVFAPNDRLTPGQALQHPFLTTPFGTWPRRG